MENSTVRAALAAATFVLFSPFCIAAFADASAQELARRQIVISLDNHIIETDEFQIDEDVLRKNIRNLLDRVRPVRVMAFAVGHDGHAQYPSKAFPAIAPSAEYPKLKALPFDLLQVWKEETAKTGTRFFIYVSTLKNYALLPLKPDYFRRFINTAQATVIDHNSAYMDEVLLPGLQELIDRYDPDGFFLDGDYWTVHESWNEASVDGFYRQYGLKAPTDYADKNYRLFQKYTYDSYRGYVQKLADFFKAQKRPVNWSINGAFTVRDPSTVPDNIGNITIDLPFFALVESHIESLFGQRLNKETEIVYPLFAQSEGSRTIQYKSSAQLKQEMAVAVANRSLVHFYLPLGPHGEISLADLDPAIKVYDELDAHFGFATPSHSEQRLATEVALVNDNPDAIWTRDFSALRSASISLFERGIVHAIISDSQAIKSRFSHLVFPGMNRVEDPALIPTLMAEGKKVLWVFDPAKADDATMHLAASFAGSPNPVLLPPLCDRCAAYRGSAGGELWIMPTLSSTALGLFLNDAKSVVSFPDKPDYVYPIAYSEAANPNRITIFLSSVAWGGPSIGRHTLFDSLDVVPEMTIRFATAHACVQHTLQGDYAMPAGETISLKSFDTVSKIDCE
jgi:alpha-L-fucosidase-like protein